MKNFILYFLLFINCSLILTADNQNCTEECEAYTSNPSTSRAYCQGDEIDIHTNYYNKDSLHAQTYFFTLFQDSTLVAINDEGLFSDLEPNRYKPYALNYAIGDATVPKVGEHLNLLEGCYELEENYAVTIVSPIEVIAEPVCIEGYGYLIDLTISGGHTQYYGSFDYNRTKYLLNFNNIENNKMEVQWQQDSSSVKVRIANEGTTPFEDNSDVNLSIKDDIKYRKCIFEETLHIEETENCEVFLKAMPDEFVVYSNYQETFTFNLLDNDIGDQLYVTSVSNIPDDLDVSWKVNGEISVTATAFCPENYAKRIIYQVKDNYGNESQAIATLYIFREDIIEVNYDWDCYENYNSDYGDLPVKIFVSGGLFPKTISGTINQYLHHPDTIEVLIWDGEGIQISVLDTVGHEASFYNYDIYCHHYYAPITADIECITDTSASYGFSDYTMSYFGLQEEDILGTGNNSILYNNENYFTYFQDSWGYTIAFPIQGTISCFNANPDYLKTRFHTKAAAINVLCNDISLHPQLAAIEEPQNGTLQWETNGNVFYTPNEDFTGLERLIYTLQNADGITDTSILTIEVAGEDGILMLPALLEITDERDCSPFEATGNYQVYLHIEGGYPPYTLSGDTSLVIDSASIVGPFDYSDTEGYYFEVRDAKHYFTEIDQRLCQTNCTDDGYFTANYTLTCQDDHTAILEYQICPDDLPYYHESEYILTGNQSGDILEEWERFEVYAVNIWELDTLWQMSGINDCLALPELTLTPDSLFVPTDTFKIFNVFGNDIGNGLQLDSVFADTNNTNFNFTWVGNGSIYLETGSEVDTIVLQYRVTDELGQVGIGEIWISTYSKFLFSVEKDCSVFLPNKHCRYAINAIMQNGRPPYELNIFNAENNSLLTTEFFEESPSFYTDSILHNTIELRFTVKDALGTEFSETIFPICSSLGCVYYPCNEDCFDTDLAIENVRFICQGDGEATLMYDIVGGDGNYEQPCGDFQVSGSTFELNEVLGFEKQIVVLDGNTCSAEVNITLETCLPNLQKDTLYLQTTSNTHFDPLANDIGEGLQLDSVFTDHESLQFTWEENGYIRFEVPEDTSSTTVHYIITDSFNQKDTAQIYVKIVPRFSIDYKFDCSEVDSTGLVNVELFFSGGGPPYYIVTDGFSEVFEEAGSFSFTTEDNSILNFQVSSGLLDNNITYNRLLSCEELCGNLQITSAYQCFLDSLTQTPFAILYYQATGGYEGHTYHGNSQNDTLQNGDFYQVEVTAAHGCIANTSDSIYCQFTSIENSTIHTPLPIINLYPNPNEGNFTLSIESKQAEEVDIEIFDIVGRAKLWQRLTTLPTVERERDFNLDLPNGLYFIRVSSNNWIWTEKMIVK